MALTTSQLINDYGSYSGGTLIGIRGARATVPSSGWSGVQGVPYDNITFIVKINGTRYASSKWLSEQKNGNPYIHKTSVPRIDFQDIPNAPIDSITDITGTPKTLGGTRAPLTLKQGEKFAEVSATSKLTNDTTILSFINDLLSDDPNVKPWQNYGEFVGAPRPVPVPGTITSPTGKTYEVGVTTPYGGTYNPELDMSAEYPGMEFRPKTVSLLGLSGEEAAAVNIPSDTQVVDVEEEAVDIIPIDLSDITIDPIDIDIDFEDFDFGFGNLGGLGSLNFGYGLGGDVAVGGTGQFTNNNYGTDSFSSLSNVGGLSATGLEQQYNTGNVGPLGALFSDDDLNKLNN